MTASGQHVLSVLNVARTASIRGLQNPLLPRSSPGPKRCLFLTPCSLKQELSRIWEQLEHMTGVVQGQPPPAETPSIARERRHNHGLAIKDTFLGFPFMTVQTTAFMDLLGFDRSFALVPEKMERGRQTVSGHSSGVPIVMVDFQRASEYVVISLPKMIF